MKKWIIPVICVVCTLFLLVTTFSSHKGVTYTSIGETYNQFWFIPAKSANFTVTFKSSYSGNLTLIDDKGSQLSNSKYTIYVDGKKSGSSFSVNDKRIVRVSIRCSATVAAGKQYVQVKGGGPLITHVYFTHRLNPLLVWISWIVTLLSVISLVWFLFLRRLIYPQFGTCQKTIMIPNQSPLIVKLTGARMVVISSVQKKQSVWDALIKGPIVYEIHPEFTSPIFLRPVRGGRVLARVDGSIYRISPNPMPKIGYATIVNVCSNKTITIN